MASKYSSIDSTENISESVSSSPSIKDDFFNQLLMCGICLSRMTSPCCLPCAHSFCRPCLLDYARNNDKNTTVPNYFILCPYCKYQLNFHSYEHLGAMLIINPVLKQLCEALDTSKLNLGQGQQTQSNAMHQARCHTCGLLKMLKICKHCHFMLCETCRREHLLDVHRESKLQLDLFETRINLINKKRLEMNKIFEEYDDIRQQIQNYAERFKNQIEQQRDQALQVLNERKNSSDKAFWKEVDFDNSEKFEDFVLFIQTAQKKLSAKHITDKDLLDLSDSLRSIPDINDNAIELIPFVPLSVELDEIFSTKQFINVCDNQGSQNKNEKPTNQNEQADCNSS